jgi:Na+-driven multidrug efflux pump
MIVVMMPNANDFDAKYEKMTKAPVERLVLGLAAPTITIMLISALYNMADTYFVGSLGTSAVAGVGVAFPLMNVIQAVGFFFGQGAGNYVSRQFGAMKLDDASKMVATGFFTTLTVGVALAAAGIAFLDVLVVSLGATPTIMPYAKSYIFYILLGIPWMTASLMLNNLLRFQGSASYAMIGMVSGAVVNVVLDPALIYVCKMGVAGAALATMISQFISFCLLLSGCAKSGNVHISPRNFTSPASALALARQGLFLLPILYLLSHAFGLLGIQASQPLADAATFALSIPFNIRVMRGMKQ